MCPGGGGEANATGSQVHRGLAATRGSSSCPGPRFSLLMALCACFLLSPPAETKTKWVSGMAEAVKSNMHRSLYLQIMKSIQHIKHFKDLKCIQFLDIHQLRNVVEQNYLFPDQYFTLASLTPNTK